jgi:hypothetical protein
MTCPGPSSSHTIALIRHPLDVALSNADHFENERAERAIELRTRVAGPPGLTLGAWCCGCSVRRSYAATPNVGVDP